MSLYRHREETINTQLALLISNLGIHADAEVILDHGSARPDVLFVLRGLRVTIEGKFADHPQAAETVFGDAELRIRQGIAHLAAAVIYPTALRTVPSSDLESALTHATLRFRILSETGSTDWFEGTPDAVMDSLRRAQDLLVQDDVVATAAKALSDRLDQVSALWTEQPTICDRLSTLIGMPVPPTEDLKTALARRSTAAKVSALVIANALIFQEQLATTDGRVTPLRQWMKASDIIKEAQLQWHWIWQNINYVPIFQLGERIVEQLPLSSQTLQAMRGLLDETMAICAQQSALRHDLMGRIYHWLLHEAKYLGTYYTSVPAATLLAELALSAQWDQDFGDPRSLAEFKVADLACGTGTLLMAASQSLSDAYIRRRSATGRSLNVVDMQTLHRTLMENVLYGYDVLPSAIHLTASTLALLAPEVAFVRMNLFIMPMGMDHERPRLGSLDFLDNSNKVFTQILLDDSQREIVKTSVSKELVGSAKVPRLDLCIMNPPFVRSVGGNLLFGSLPDDRGRLQAELRRKSQRIGASITAGLGSAFVALAHQSLRPGGRLAFVLPHALSSGEAWGATRQLIAQHYHLEMVITSHDAEHPNFSENTDLSELLFIARKLHPRETPGDTNYVSLWTMPRSLHDAMDLATRIQAVGSANAIRSHRGKLGEHFTMPTSIGSAPWTGALFAQGTLARVADGLSHGVLEFMEHSTPVPLCALKTLGTLGPDRRDVHDAFTVAASAEEWSPYRAFWNHDARHVQTMAQSPNSVLLGRVTSAPGRHLRSAEDLWKMAGSILLVERLWSITHRTLAIAIDQPVLGNTWWPLQFESLSSSQQKALVLWLNSTLSLVLFFGHRVVTRGPWVQMKKPAWLAMPVLDVRALSEAQLTTLSEAYDVLANQPLAPLSQVVTDPTRHALDAALTSTLGLPDLGLLRELLGREPGLTGRSLGERV